ncbi:unnamed protein product [Closterium sp. Yama58-4]|nr:unnamed protein product [Closterium sp. Yama58-4]
MIKDGESPKLAAGAMREGVSEESRDRSQASQLAGNGRQKEWNRPEAIAGAVAGMATVAILHPLDIVRTRFQVNDGRDPTIPRYRGVVSAITTISRFEGIRGLYAGLYPSMVGSSLSWALYFFLYSHAKERYMAYFSAMTSTGIGNSDRRCGSCGSKSDRRHDGSGSSSGTGMCPSTEKSSAIVSKERLLEQIGASTMAAHGVGSDGGGSSNCREDRIKDGSILSSTTVAHGDTGGGFSIQGGTAGGGQRDRPGSETDAAAAGVGVQAGSSPDGRSCNGAIRTDGGNTGRCDGREQGVVAGKEIESSSKSSGGVEVERRSDKSWRSTMVNLAAATETGILVVLLTNPIWLAKTRLQLQGALDPKGPHTMHHPPVLAGLPVLLVLLFPPVPPARSRSHRQLHQGRQQQSYRIITPGSTEAFMVLHDAIWSIVKEEGFRGLYRGIGPSLILVSHGAIQMAAYEELKQLMLALRSPSPWAAPAPTQPRIDSHPSSSSSSLPAHPAVTELSPWDIAAVGATAKLCAASATYPYQVVRARLQMRPNEVGQLKYRNTQHAVTSMWRLEGAREASGRKHNLPVVIMGSSAISLATAASGSVVKAAPLSHTMHQPPLSVRPSESRVIRCNASYSQATSVRQTVRFRPCIDIHKGKVKQIVGSTLRDLPSQDSSATASSSSSSEPVTNFESDRSAAEYASMYAADSLPGGHVIMLGADPASQEAALGALNAFPGGLHVGGGITPENAEMYLDAGASHVIVTSYVFRDGKVDEERLRRMVNAVAPERLVLDLSCRKKGEHYYVVTDRWQRFTSLVVDGESLARLADCCDEFLVHGVDVEGMKLGIDEELVSLLGKYSPIPVTYAGGVRSLEDLEIVKAAGRGAVDVTVGSALDIFGGDLPYREVVEWHRSQSKV